ncbi:MAG: hypothetical protein QNJ98_01505 [Planctomycetota bacterium]|nr:hypothetical protein [Planctomycetota bacterium]
MNPRIARLIPPLALALLVAVAAISTQAIQAQPRAAIYAQTHALARALSAGDMDAVLALQQPPEDGSSYTDRVAELEQQAEMLRGRSYMLTAIEPQPDGAYAAEIRWIADARGNASLRLEVTWRKSPDGVWRLP